MTAMETLSRRLLPWLKPAAAKLGVALQEGNLGHAWLVSGPAGVGKVNLALVLARRLLGDAAEPDALAASEALAAMASRHEPADRHPDLYWLHPEEDKQSIAIEQVRDVTEALTLTAHRGGAKVVVIEPAEALTTAAANALLKTLEEPTAGGYLLLLSHQPGRLPATIRSRCQHLVLPPPTSEALAAWLGVAPAAVSEAKRSVGPSPLRIAAALQDSQSSIFNKLESEIAELSQDRSEPLAMAAAWAKGDPELALGWLRRRLHEELRARHAQPSGSTEVTVRAGATLHNAWRPLPTRTLFEVYDRAEKLLNQLGSGLNVELAIAAMLNALVVNRGRS